jgi:nucleoside-diphosphate-sugar epimerase
MKVLITGGTGFVGGHLVERFLKEGFEVRALVRKSSKLENLKRLKAEIVFGDVTKKESLKKALRDVEKVFHIAALFRQARFPDKAYWEVNARGTENILEASLEAGVGQFVHCSTVGVLSHISNPPADETHPYNPGDVYQESKAEGEKLALRYWRDRSLPVVVVRPAMVYGPGDLRLLKLFKAIARGRFIMLGSGKTLAHFVYIDDLIQGFLKTASEEKAEGEVYIIAGETPITLNELAKMIAEELNVSLPPIHLPVKPFQVLGSICETLCRPLKIEPPIFRRRVDFFTKDRSFNIAKARRELNYSPCVGMKEGIKRTATWYKKKGYL